MVGGDRGPGIPALVIADVQGIVTAAADVITFNPCRAAVAREIHPHVSPGADLVCYNLRGVGSIYKNTCTGSLDAVAHDQQT